MAEFDRTPIEADDQFHHYRGNVIPWFVRLIWIGFWIFAITYAIRYLLPAVQTELLP